MNTALFYDCETQGIPLFKEPSEHPEQPHIVQVAACLVDVDTRKTLAQLMDEFRAAPADAQAALSAAFAKRDAELAEA